MNFELWVSRNFRDYEVPADRKVVAPAKEKVIIRREQSPRKPEVQPAGASKKTASQLAESKEHKSSTVHLEEALGTDIVAPIQEKLTVLQIQTLILQNLEVLGRICKAKGAVSEFNALMLKLGAEDEVIVQD
jgi:hypothetical protein